jgi:hypothetical protein
MKDPFWISSSSMNRTIVFLSLGAMGCMIRVLVSSADLSDNFIQYRFVRFHDSRINSDYYAIGRFTSFRNSARELWKSLLNRRSQCGSRTGKVVSECQHFASIFNYYCDS